MRRTHLIAAALRREIRWLQQRQEAAESGGRWEQEVARIRKQVHDLRSEDERRGRALDRTPEARIEEIEARLKNDRITLDFTPERPLNEAVEFLSRETGLIMVVDSKALAESGLPSSAPVKLVCKNVSLRTALKLMLTPLNLTYRVEPGLVVITSLLPRGLGDSWVDPLALQAIWTDPDATDLLRKATSAQQAYAALKAASLGSDADPVIAQARRSAAEASVRYQNRFEQDRLAIQKWVLVLSRLGPQDWNGDGTKQPFVSHLVSLLGAGPNAKGEAEAHSVGARLAFLDLVGRVPDAEEMERFVLGGEAEMQDLSVNRVLESRPVDSAPAGWTDRVRKLYESTWPEPAPHDSGR